MMATQHKITACGLNKHDQVTLKSFLKVLNLDASSPWVYSDEKSAEVVIVDSEQEAGQDFVYWSQIGMHDGKVMVSLGENSSGLESAHSLSRPLSCGNLCKVFEKLIDVNGGLVDTGI